MVEYNEELFNVLSIVRAPREEEVATTWMTERTPERTPQELVKWKGIFNLVREVFGACS
jgi:hypothetical protein